MYQKVTLPVTLNDVWRSLQLQKPLEYQYVGYLLCPRSREGGNKRCFCPTDRPSVVYITNFENPKAYRAKFWKEGSPPSMQLAYQFQSQKVKGQSHQAH